MRRLLLLACLAAACGPSPGKDGGVGGGAGGDGGGGGGAGGGGFGHACSADSGVGGGDDGGPADAGDACDLPPVRSSRQLDFDLQVASVSGTLTLAGAAVPDTPPDSSRPDGDRRGDVVLTGPHGTTYVFPVGRTGAAVFSGLVFAGRYDIDFRSVGDPSLVGLPPGQTTRLASGVQLSASPALDFDLQVAQLGGQLTLDGAGWPHGASAPGAVLLRDAVTGSLSTVALAASGPATFSGRVFAGRFDGDFASGPADGPFPAFARVPLARGLLVAGSQTVGFDVQRAAVGGTVRLGGAALPDSPQLPVGVGRGVVVFEDLLTGQRWKFGVGATGAATFSGVLPLGRYRTSFVTPNQAALEGLPAGQTALLEEMHRVGCDEQLELSLTLCHVSGAVTLDGQAMPDSPQLPAGTPRGYLAFLDVRTGAQTSLAVGATGPARYSGALFAGRYDVTYAATGDYRLVGLSPAASAIFQTGADLAQDTARDYDVQQVQLWGVLTLDGGEPGVDGGRIVVIDAYNLSEQDLPLEANGTFSGTVIAGTYHLVLETETNVESGLARDLEVRPGLAPLAYDVPVVQVGGTLTVGGQPLADFTGPRGFVTLQEQISGYPVIFEVSATGPATWGGTLFGGALDVYFQSAPTALQFGLPPAGERLGLACFP